MKSHLALTVAVIAGLELNLGSPGFAQENIWVNMGTAATGERIWLDRYSVQGSQRGVDFRYKIGNEIINATANCSRNQWYAEGYGTLSPQSRATQAMLNYVCNAQEGWLSMGRASTGELIDLDRWSIQPVSNGINFRYRIGNEVINARANCRLNQWYAEGYGVLSPQSSATQLMLNTVCDR